MIIIIPCAGYGTRLQSVSGNVHKSLVEVGGVPLLSRIVDNLKNLNPKKIIIITNDLFYDQFQIWIKKYNSKNKNIILLNDGSKNNNERLGTLKDVLLALKDNKSKFLVYLGDNLIQGDLNKPLKQFMDTNINTIVLHDVNNSNNAKKFGVVELNQNNYIIGLEEKPNNPKSTLISTGIYFFNAEIKQIIEEYLDKGNSPEGFGFLIQNTYKNVIYQGYILDKSFKWIDIGTPESLLDANKQLNR
jgi:glucose-1-phosphate thymidylyltransferase